MGKRYTDTSKWDDPWFLELTQAQKLVWEYLYTKCDAVGVWKPSAKSVNFHTGANIDLDYFLKVCGPERIFVMPNGNWWITKFCDFQYGELKETSTSPTTKTYIKLLKNHNLWIPYTKGISRAIYSPKEKEQEKEKDKEEEKDKGGAGGFSETELLELLNDSFDEIYIDSLKSVFRNLDVNAEVEKFKVKVRGSPNEYKGRDKGGLRLALHYHLSHAKVAPTPLKIKKLTAKDMGYE